MAFTWRSSALSLLLLGTSEGRSALGSTHHGRPVLNALRALRGGEAGAQSMLWVRRTNESKTMVQLVRSLTAFCEEHDLDEDSMRAVSRGDADEHEGWECGEVIEYDAPVTAEAEEVTVETVEAGMRASKEEDDDEEDEVADSDASPVKPSMPPIQMNKMIIGFIAPMVATRVSARPLTIPTLAAA